MNEIQKEPIDDYKMYFEDITEMMKLVIESDEHAPEEIKTFESKAIIKKIKIARDYLLDKNNTNEQIINQSNG